MFLLDLERSRGFKDIMFVAMKRLVSYLTKNFLSEYRFRVKPRRNPHIYIFKKGRRKKLFLGIKIVQ